jgi:polyhydroxybutyrate depolymerase
VEPQIKKWMIDGVARHAIIYPPSAPHGRDKAPLIFAYHGHGDNAWFATEQFAFHTLWPEAIVVYPQGIPTPADSDPAGERRGWQHLPGEVNDRDLKFFDAMLRTLRWDFHVDDHRIYAAGFSNGGFFDYILWAKRPQIFAAFAPCAAALRSPVQISTRRPAMVVAGEKDDRVSFAEQQTTIATLREINGCAKTGQPWGEGAVQYPSASGTPVVALIHPWGHAVRRAATVMLVKFFQEHSLP